MVLRLLLIFSLIMPAAAHAEKETVVLLHGLGLGSWAMARLGHALTRDGYHVVNLTYPSRSVPLETLAREWLPAQLRSHEIASAPRLHFVTHSMGGILVRTWLDQQLRTGTTLPANLGRVVMIAPPNQGSAVAEKLQSFPPFRWFTGVNGRRLGTSPTSLPRTLGPWPSAALAQTSALATRANADTGADAASATAVGQLGIIAGDRSLNPLFSAWLAGPNDGKVAVASTHLSGETAHRVLHHSHTWLQWHADTAHAVSTFLRTGRFD
jgi:triacylglycerol lipase